MAAREVEGAFEHSTDVALVALRRGFDQLAHLPMRNASGPICGWALHLDRFVPLVKRKDPSIGDKHRYCKTRHDASTSILLLQTITFEYCIYEHTARHFAPRPFEQQKKENAVSQTEVWLYRGDSAPCNCLGTLSLPPLHCSNTRLFAWCHSSFCMRAHCSIWQR